MSGLADPTSILELARWLLALRKTQCSRLSFPCLRIRLTCNLFDKRPVFIMQLGKIPVTKFRFSYICSSPSLPPFHCPVPQTSLIGLHGQSFLEYMAAVLIREAGMNSFAIFIGYVHRNLAPEICHYTLSAREDFCPAFFRAHQGMLFQTHCPLNLVP